MMSTDHFLKVMLLKVMLTCQTPVKLRGFHLPLQTADSSGVMCTAKEHACSPYGFCCGRAAQLNNG